MGLSIIIKLLSLSFITIPIFFQILIPRAPLSNSWLVARGSSLVTRGSSLVRVPRRSPLTASPHTLCGPARCTRTVSVRPIHAAGPGRFTATFVLVRPDSSVSRRRLAESISTSTSCPTSAWFSSVWIPRCSVWSSTIRLVFSASSTSSGSRFSASVFGRSEYLNENMLW